MAAPVDYIKQVFHRLGQLGGGPATTQQLLFWAFLKDYGIEPLVTSEQKIESINFMPEEWWTKLKASGNILSQDPSGSLDYKRPTTSPASSSLSSSSSLPSPLDSETQALLDNAEEVKKFLMNLATVAEGEQDPFKATTQGKASVKVAGKQLILEERDALDLRPLPARVRELTSDKDLLKLLEAADICLSVLSGHTLVDGRPHPGLQILGSKVVPTDWKFFETQFGKYPLSSMDSKELKEEASRANDILHTAVNLKNTWLIRESLLKGLEAVTMPQAELPKWCQVLQAGLIIATELRRIPVPSITMHQLFDQIRSDENHMKNILVTNYSEGWVQRLLGNAKNILIAFSQKSFVGQRFKPHWLDTFKAEQERALLVVLAMFLMEEPTIEPIAQERLAEERDEKVVNYKPHPLALDIYQEGEHKWTLYDFYSRIDRKKKRRVIDNLLRYDGGKEDKSFQVGIRYLRYRAARFKKVITKDGKDVSINDLVLPDLLWFPSAT